jgi:putative component of membrane protein insertase Oxa1/YidC/SpoIIIJ protein YidD
MLFNRLKTIIFIGIAASSSLFALPGYHEPWGKDADLRIPALVPSPLSLSLLGIAADQVIRFHQTFLNRVDGPRSHFRPTSSKYMQLAIRQYGFFKGFIIGCDRLLRENDAAWVYRTIEIDGKLYKHDPVP